MTLLQLTSLILLLPILYALYKIYKKRELNMFDFLLMFTILHFAISPLLSKGYHHYSEIYIYKVFLVLALFETSLLSISLLWDYYYSTSNSIINTTRYFRNLESVDIKKVGFVVLGGILFAVIVIYMPYATLATRIENANDIINKDYAFKSTLAILSSGMSILLMTLSLRMVLQFKKGKVSPIEFGFTLFCFLICAFFPRRFFLQNLLFLILLFYSTCREKINFRFMVIVSVSAFLVFQIYFPFYNIIRNNPIRLNPNAPLQSLYEIVQYGIENQSFYKKAEESTRQRSVGLYDALYSLQRNGKMLQGGDLIISEIDIAIPKIINPDKGNGSEGTLESMTGRYTDIADSYLLESCGDFGVFGGIVAVLLYMAVFGLYYFADKLLNMTTGQKLLSIFVLYGLFEVCWNVEGKFGSALSSFFSSFIWVVLLFLCSYFGIIYVKERRINIRQFINSHITCV